MCQYASSTICAAGRDTRGAAGSSGSVLLTEISAQNRPSAFQAPGSAASEDRFLNATDDAAAKFRIMMISTTNKMAKASAVSTHVAAGRNAGRIRGIKETNKSRASSIGTMMVT